MSPEEREVYSNDQTKFQEEYNKRINAASESFKATNIRLEKLNTTIKLNDKLTAESAKAWVGTLETMKLGGASVTELEGMDSSLNQILAGLTEEQANQVMSEINAIDKKDKNAWEGLSSRFEELGLMAKINDQALQKFIQSGIQTSKAIDKINFDTLAKDINDTYKLLEKVKEGGRSYSEDDYKAFVAANSDLKDQFTQIGDEFIYVGGSMEKLTDALEKNTVAKLDEVNRQLKSRGEMAKIIEEESKNVSVEHMNETQARDYLTEMRQRFLTSGLNIEDFGIEGLSNTTDFSQLSAEQIKKMAKELALEGGKASVYKQDYAKGLRQANIQRFTHNDAIYNAKMAVEGGEYAGQHQEALILQAIQSGAVTNSMIEAYRKAIESGDRAAVKDLGEKIANAADQIVEESEGRDAYVDLVNRTSEAIKNASQKEIDKLGELNDAISSSNEKLISKIQEQINKDRQARENQKAEQEITDMYSQQAYLSMDTSGSSLLMQQELNKQVEEAEQNYQDTLVDQAIQNLQDANDQAAEQRERQIELAQQQLDWQIENGDLTREAEEIVSSSLQKIANGESALNTQLGTLLWGEEGKGLGELESQEWVSNLSTAAVQAQNWFSAYSAPKENNTGNQEQDTEQPVSGMDYSNQVAQNALADARGLLTNATKGGFAALNKDDSELDIAYKKYLNTTGKSSTEFTRLDFARAAVGEEYNKYNVLDCGYFNYVGNNWDFGDAAVEDEVGGVTLNNGKEIRLMANGTSAEAATAAYNAGVGEGRLFKWTGGYYIYTGGQAYKIVPNKRDWSELTKAYKTGGLADFTGPAWLDGTKSHPEYVLNADQTERFFSLVDILEGYDKDRKPEKSGDNYFEIAINVEKLENDYDVEQVADKIRKMIYEDASYRNVNAINHIR